MADFRSSLSATIATMPSNKSKGKVPLMKSHSRITGHCHTCQKSPQDLGRDKPFAACSKCREVVYCGVECQRENWPVHKLACALSRERKALLAGNPIKANNTARFTRWFDSPIKIDVFRQAVMHAMDVVNHPERVDQKVFLMECDLHPDHANRRPEDKYILKKGHMFPRDEVFRPDGGFNGGQHAHFLEYLKVQNDIVKRRGQLGVVPVIMLDVSCKDEGQMAMPNWWPLALPGMVEDARQILKDTKWGNVFWMSRLRDILAAPESTLVFNDGGVLLPDHLLRDTPITDSVFVVLERNINDPNREVNERNQVLAPADRGVDFDTSLDSCCVM